MGVSVLGCSSPPHAPASSCQLLSVRAPTTLGQLRDHFLVHQNGYCHNSKILVISRQQRSDISAEYVSHLQAAPPTKGIQTSCDVASKMNHWTISFLLQTRSTTSSWETEVTSVLRRIVLWWKLHLFCCILVWVSAGVLDMCSWGLPPLQNNISPHLNFSNL